MSRVKLALYFVGTALALLGIAWDNRAVVWSAICVLGTALLLRIVLQVRARRKRPSESDSAA